MVKHAKFQKSVETDEIMKKQAPDCVAQTIMNRLDELEIQIREYEDMLRILKQEYTAHAQFLCSFGAGNLSQNEGSDNKGESPQATA